LIPSFSIVVIYKLFVFGVNEKLKKLSFIVLFTLIHVFQHCLCISVYLRIFLADSSNNFQIFSKLRETYDFRVVDRFCLKIFVELLIVAFLELTLFDLKLKILALEFVILTNSGDAVADGVKVVVVTWPHLY